MAALKAIPAAAMIQEIDSALIEDEKLQGLRNGVVSGNCSGRFRRAQAICDGA